ncbi:MAG: glycosyl transferase group 1 [Candidatus Kaiserbacteria bacterium]|nr:glycosyl transferase group 1 [Candidatus Kaiserbacteria bacterium]
MSETADKRNRKIRIAIDTTYMDRRPAMGTAIWIRQTVIELLPYRSEFDITLIHREKIPEDPLYSEFKEVIIPRIRLPKYASFFSELFFFLTTRTRYDIYYFAYSRIYPFFWLAPATKIVFAAMDGGPQTAGYGAYKNTKVPWYVRLFLYKVDMFIGLTDFGSSGISEAYRVPRDRIRTIYCGMNDKFHSVEQRTESPERVLAKYNITAPYVLSVSRFDPHKNILGTINGFKKFIDSTDAPHILVLVGTRHMKDYSEQIDSLIAELGLSERVKIVPFVDDEDLPVVYQAATFFVFPSFYEGFGMPAVEAMACGTPVLVSDRASLPEVIGGIGEIADPYDADSIAAGMIKLLDPQYRERLSRLGKEHVRTFRWSETARKLVDVFRSVAQ